MSPSVFEEIRNKTTGALDRAKLVFGRDESPSSNPSEDSETEDSQQSDSVNRLEELAEYCPKLSFQEVSTS